MNYYLFKKGKDGYLYPLLQGYIETKSPNSLEELKAGEEGLLNNIYHNEERKDTFKKWSKDKVLFIR